MNAFIAGLALGLVLGLLIGSALAGILVRRAIILNLKRIADSRAMVTWNAHARGLKPQQIARMAIREAASILSGEPVIGESFPDPEG